MFELLLIFSTESQINSFCGVAMKTMRASYTRLYQSEIRAD